MTTPAYDDLARRHRRLYRLQHLQALAFWDSAAMMPPKGQAARGEAMAELAALLHGLRTDAAVGDLLQRADAEPLADGQRANLREMRRGWQRDRALPESLVERLQQTTARCEHAWRSQRPANDWAAFSVNLREVVALTREAAARLSDHLGLSRYDALLDDFEPGMTSAELDRVFGGVLQWLPGLVDRVIDHQARLPVPLVEPTGPFGADAQRRLGEQAMRCFGFDFEAGRLDVSMHPFCGGVPQDVRMTTRYLEHDGLDALLSTIHETGHAVYEQHLPVAWLDQPAGHARSMAIHESQSLGFEMQIARHPGFVARLAPWLAEAYGAQPAFEPANLRRLLTRVRRGLIRTEADEVTYPAHVILRYQIERPLVEGQIEVDDIPALWDEKMMALLGVDTRGNHRDGAMQDVHWSEGLFGYFPCYTLGAMYAAQWFATMRRSIPGLDDTIAAGDLAPVFGWLDRHVWSQGSLRTTDELVTAASGGPLDPDHLKAHLEARYLGG